MKGSGGALGRALIKDKNRRADNANKVRRQHDLANAATQQHKDKSTVLPAEKPQQRKYMGSVTHTTDLGALMESAALADRTFAVEKENMIVLTKTATLLPPANPPTSKIAERAEADILAIPRRPQWNRRMKAADVDKQERESFLDWRRNLALTEERDNLLLTPYEKNIEIWRQLWRVVERSDAVVQVVDVRDPLFFCCQDLNRYIAEVSAQQERKTPKKTLLLLNKSDLLTEKQRIAWAKYLTEKGMDFVFFSALQENTRREAARKAQEEAEAAASLKKEEDKFAALDLNEDEEQEKEEEKEEKKQEEEEVKEEEKKKEEEEKKKEEEIKQEESKEEVKEEEKLTEEELKWRDLAKVLNSVELHDKFAAFAQPSEKKPEEGEEKPVEEEKPKQPAKKGKNRKQRGGKKPQMKEYEPPQDGSVVIGMVGYPNVGKSSTINALCGEKRVAVTSQPGKTKHFQTIKLTPLVTLCDCPGLVFPTFLNSKAEMVCNGVLSIDQCTDYISPVALICQRIPHSILCSRYAVSFTTDEEAAEARLSMDAQPLDTVTESNEAQRFLSAVAKVRGFMTQSAGCPDQSRVARIVVKDYLKGTLFYAMPPPGLSPAEFVAWQGSGSTSEAISAPPPPSSNVLLQTAGKGHKKAHGRKTRARAAAATKNGYSEDGEQYLGTVHVSGRNGTNDYQRTHWKHSPIPVDVLKAMSKNSRPGVIEPSNATHYGEDDEYEYEYDDEDENEDEIDADEIEEEENDEDDD